MEKNTTASFSAELNSLHPMLEWIRTHLEGSGLSDIEIRRIEIALEEALVNIISYAYQEDRGRIELGYHLKQGKFVELTIKDQGLPFNPLKQAKRVDPLATLEEREEGGLGLLFVHKLMDKVEYTRYRETNILTLKKNL